MNKYNPCRSGVASNLSIPCCPPIIGQGSAIPESARVNICTSSFVLGAPIVATQPPVVNVGTTPASVTTTAAAVAASNAAVNTYNPATRFSQYFPPAPLPFMPPSMFRVPNNDPKPSVVTCTPLRRYESTAETIAKGGR